MTDNFTITKSKALLVTGGAGFIGANFIPYILTETEFKGKLINVDALTYAGNLESLAAIQDAYPEQYVFEKADICDDSEMRRVFEVYDIDCVVHFAAESHVDRSIHGPKAFVETNVNGTFNLLEAARQHWGDRKDVRFHHVSTDEVYGSLGETGFFFETTPYDPRSPYSSSKAASDHLVRAYYHTYGLPVTISNCSNNYGPFQFPEKLIPVIIQNCLSEKPIPIYGDGKNVRDWLYVEDHCSAIYQILVSGTVGETYNVGGESERNNLQIVDTVCGILDELSPSDHLDKYADLVEFVKDRPGHDRRYAINCDKLKDGLGWKQSVSFEDGMRLTVKWYLDHQEWVDHINSGDYLRWIQQNYEDR